MIKLSNVTKRMAIVKPTGGSKGSLTSGEIIITRSKGDGTTVGVKHSAPFTKAVWRTYDVEELKLAIEYVTMPNEDFKKLLAEQVAND